MIGEANEKLSQERTTEISEGFGEKYNDRTEDRENTAQTRRILLAKIIKLKRYSM